MGLEKFKIHPSIKANFYDWVSYTPTSKISSIGRKMNISRKKPNSISFELINEFEKKAWGKISFEEFLRQINNAEDLK